MNAHITDSVTLQSVTPDRLQRYLKAKGWKQTGFVEQCATVWEYESEQLLLPIAPKLADYARRVADALVTLSRVEHRSELDILRDIDQSLRIYNTNREYFALVIGSQLAAMVAISWTASAHAPTGAVQVVQVLVAGSAGGLVSSLSRETPTQSISLSYALNLLTGASLGLVVYLCVAGGLFIWPVSSDGWISTYCLPFLGGYAERFIPKIAAKLVDQEQARRERNRQ